MEITDWGDLRNEHLQARTMNPGRERTHPRRPFGRSSMVGQAVLFFSFLSWCVTVALPREGRHFGRFRDSSNFPSFLNRIDSL